nr:MAG TPA: hypothetical protein [Caudoviricetes sp.]
MQRLSQKGVQRRLAPLEVRGAYLMVRCDIV